MRYIYLKDDFHNKELLYYFKDNFNALEKKAYDSAVDYYKSSTDDRDTEPTNVFLITNKPTSINGYRFDDKYYLVCTLFQNESGVLDALNKTSIYDCIMFESNLELSKVIYNIIDIIPEYFL